MRTLLSRHGESEANIANLWLHISNVQISCVLSGRDKAGMKEGCRPAGVVVDLPVSGGKRRYLCVSGSKMKFMNKLFCIWLLIGLSACTFSSQATPSEPVAESLPSATEMVTATADFVAETSPTPAEIERGITFTKTLGGKRRDRGINLLQTIDGGYALVGYTASLDPVQEDVYLVRVDPQGGILWSRTYGGEGRDNGWAFLETEDNGFLIVGFTNSFGAGEMDIYLVRTDAEGNMLWERTFGGPKDEFGWAMAPAADGGYVLAGQTDSFGEGEEDGYLIKVNAQGEEIWSQTFGGLQEDRLFSVDQSADSGFILTGTTQSFGAGSRDLYLIKTSSTGELTWMQVFGEDRDDVGHSVRQTADRGYIVTGYTKSFGAKNYDSWLIKIDEVGDFQWQKLFGGAGDDRTIFGEQTHDGGYILTGYTKSFEAVDWDVFLVRTDASGEVIWYKVIGGDYEDTGYTVRQTSDNGFILTGETYSFGEGGGDMYIIKVNQDGEIIE